MLHNILIQHLVVVVFMEVIVFTDLRDQPLELGDSLLILEGLL